MRGLLERICHDEGVTVDDAVYPLVIRAGGGSPRDSLSVLDQLVAGADGNRVVYQRALSLLGATDVALIDDAVDALTAAGDLAAQRGWVIAAAATLANGRQGAPSSTYPGFRVASHHGAGGGNRCS